MSDDKSSHADIETTAALFASGGMTPEEQQRVETALGDEAEAVRRAIRKFDPAVEELAASITPIAPDPATRDAVLRIPDETPASEHEDAAPVWREWETDETLSGGLFTLPATKGQWEPTGVDGVEVRRLFVDREHNRMTAMFRMAAGAAYVPHVHDAAEECYVLEGDLHVGDDIVMHAGDYQRAAAGSHHGVQRTENGCVLLISCSLHDEVEFG